MRTKNKQFCALLLTLAMCVTVTAQTALATEPSAIRTALNDTANYIYKTVKTPQVGSIGGEWAVLSLARSGFAVPDSYYQDDYATVENYVTACGGALHEKKYTEYARVTPCPVRNR